MTTWKTNPLVVDLSHYNIFDFSLAKGYVDLVIAKCGEMTPGVTEDKQYDQTFHVNAAAAKAQGIPFGAYFFLSPDDWIVGQKTGGLPAYKNLARADNVEYQLLRKWVANKEICCLALDCEKQFINGIQANGVIPSTWIIANLSKMYEHIKQGQAAKEIPDVPIFLYSGEWYANGYCVIGSGASKTNGMYDWVATHPEVYIWSASYPAVVNPPLVTWAQVREKMILTDTMKPPYLNSATMPLLWQFNAGGGMKVLTDYQAGKPVYRETDISACSVSKEIFHEILKISVAPEPPTPPEPPVPPVPSDLEARVKSLEDKLAKIKALL